MSHLAANPNLSKTQPLVTASCYPWDKPTSCPWITALSHYPGCWPLCNQQWGVLVGWCVLSITHLWPPLSLCVLCLECSSETPLSPHSGLYSGGTLIRTLGSPPPSPHTHVCALHFNDSSCLLPASPIGVEAHWGRGLWSVLVRTLPIAYHSRPCTDRHQHQLLGWLAGWRNAVTSDSGFLSQFRASKEAGQRAVLIPCLLWIPQECFWLYGPQASLSPGD